MKCIAWVLVLLLIFPAAFSQYRSRKSVPYDHYLVAARFNLTGLADPIDNNISVGVEYPFNPHWSVITDVAYIEYSSYFSRIQRTSGYMIKPAIRFYPSTGHKGFLEAVGMYKHANYHLTDWLGRACVNGMPAYEQYTSFVYGKRVLGLNFQGGLQTELTRDKLLRFEAYFGIGLRWRQQDVIRELNSCYNQSRTELDINGISGTSVSSSFPAGMRLIYCIPY